MGGGVGKASKTQKINVVSKTQPESSEADRPQESHASAAEPISSEDVGAPHEIQAADLPESLARPAEDAGAAVIVAAAQTTVDEQDKDWLPRDLQGLTLAKLKARARLAGASAAAIDAFDDAADPKAAAIDEIVKLERSGKGTAVVNDDWSDSSGILTPPAGNANRVRNAPPPAIVCAAPTRKDPRESDAYRNRVAERDRWLASIGASKQFAAAGQISPSDQKDSSRGAAWKTAAVVAPLRDRTEGFADETRRLIQRMRPPDEPFSEQFQSDHLQTLDM